MVDLNVDSNKQVKIYTFTFLLDNTEYVYYKLKTKMQLSTVKSTIADLARLSKH